MTVQLDRLQAGDVFEWMGTRFVVDAEHYYDADVDDWVLVRLRYRKVYEAFQRDTVVDFLGMDGEIS